MPGPDVWSHLVFSSGLRRPSCKQPRAVPRPRPCSARGPSQVELLRLQQELKAQIDARTQLGKELGTKDTVNRALHPARPSKPKKPLR